MPNQPKVSVIMPVYNVEQYLPKCLASIVNQTLNDIEIICVNDGSTDNCPKILEEFKSKDDRIKIINKENGGVSIARNAGLEIASGEYIGFIDADDYIDENFFELLYNEAKENDADVACGGIKRENDGQTHFFINYSQMVITNDIYDKINFSKIVQFSFVWNKIFRHSFLKENELKFMPNVNFEDIIFSAQFTMKSDILVCVPNTFYHYVKRNESISQHMDIFDIRNDMLYSLKFMCNYFKEAGIDFNKLPVLSEIYQRVRNEKVIKKEKEEIKKNRKS